MAHSKRIRNLITVLAQTVIDKHQLSDGSTDKHAFYRHVEHLFRGQHPADVFEIEREAVGFLVQEVCDYLIRFTKKAYAVGAVRGTYRVFIQVPPEVGEGKTFILKHRTGATVGDYRRFLAYHTGMLRAHAKEVAFAKAVVTLAEQLGMADTDSASSLISESA